MAIFFYLCYNIAMIFLRGNMKKVIIFDFDNTVVNSLKYWRKTMGLDCEKYLGLDHFAGFEKLIHKKGNREAAQIFIDVHNLNMTVDEIISIWYKNMFEYYKNNCKLVLGVRQFLEALKNNGYTLVIASATNVSLLGPVLKVYELDKLFDHVVCEDFVGKNKGYPDIYNEVLRVCGAEAKDCLYFEDSLTAITTATSLGIDSVAVVSKFNAHNQAAFDKLCVKTITRYSKKLLKELGLNKSVNN